MINRKFFVFLLLSLLGGIIIFTCIPFQKAVIFEMPSNHQLLAYIPLDGKQTFQIQYTHSIHLSEVRETYQVIEDDRLQLVELMYEDMAIGMPQDASEGEVFEKIDGKYYIKNMRRTFSLFDLRVGQVIANHRLIYQDHVYPFHSFVEPGTTIRIKVDTLTLWELWKGVNVIER
ncbi:MAG: DUF1850 domain-containing protein [Bacillus sp. (in: Bacteria)]|nr:DUF1850 domain-containing protein [Bacillus sp. (in: firmicutes)]